MPIPSAPPARLTRVLGTGAQLAERARRRGEQLLLLGRDDVLAPTGIEVDSQQTVVARLPVIDGTDLAQIAATRPPLTMKQCGWLARRVAGALAAMHAAGLVHGDVSPANVVVRDMGVTLVDTLGALREDERGTPGFRAPEAVAGERTQASDVYALGRLLRWAVRDEDESEVRRRTVAWVAPSPSARPTAAAVVDALATWGGEAPVRVDAVAVAHSVRSRALERTERIAEGRWWRVRRRLARGAAAAAGIGVAAWLAVAVPRVLDEGADSASAATALSGEARPAPAASAPPTRPSVDVATPRLDPGAAAMELTRTRVAALNEEDGSALRATVTGGAAVARSARATAAALDDGSLVYDGLTVEVTQTRVLDADGEAARVEVASRMSGHTVAVDGDARDVRGSLEKAVLTLRWHHGSWRVVDAQPG